MKRVAVTGAIITIGASILFAQDAERPRPERPGGPGAGPRGMASPLMAALDANKDGELDATEISNATAALKKIDKNGDGKLSREELRPERPAGGRGEGRPQREGE